jgi:hypothetical protein
MSIFVCQNKTNRSNLPQDVVESYLNNNENIFGHLSLLNSKINKHEYRAGVAELNVYLGDTQNGGQTNIRQTHRHTGLCIELLRN